MSRGHQLLAVLCPFLALVTGCCSPYGPWITNSGRNVPVLVWPPKLVYEHQEQIHLECYPFSRTGGVRVRWGNVTITEGNYAIPSAHVKYLKEDDVYPIKLTLMYNKTQMVTQVNVSCYSTSDVYKSNSTFAIIEQRYPTSNVVINDENVIQVQATPGQAVQLECKGDGNPNAKYRFWYNKSASAIDRMPVVGRNISFTYSNETKFQYACQAKNDFLGSNSWVNSSWVEVSSSGGLLLLHSCFLVSLAVLVSALHGQSLL